MDTLHFTKHVGKLGGLYSLSTSVHCNDYCAARPTEVCKKCYAHKCERIYTSLEKCLINNSRLLSEKILDKDTLTIPKKYVKSGKLRINSFGDLINKIHGANIILLAYYNPDVEITIWTKRPELLEYIPSEIKNLHVIYSIGKLNLTEDEVKAIRDTMVSKYPFIETVYYVGDKAHGFTPCGGNCLDCGRCYPPVNGSMISQLLH